MIIEFSVENFRSIDKEQTIRFYAPRQGATMLENVVSLEEADLGILKTVGLYGANGSGKSNAIRALASLCDFVARSYRFREEKRIPFYEPCLLRSEDEPKETRMSIEFVVTNVGGERLRYLYAIAYNEQEVTYERLSCFKAKREALLFMREKNDDTTNVTYGAALRGGKRKIPCFSNQLYLSVADQTPDAPAIIRDAASFLRRDIDIYERGESYMPDPDDYNDDIMSIIENVDVGVAGVRRVRLDLDERDFVFPNDLPEGFRKRLLEREKTRYRFSHVDNGGRRFEIDLTEESDGTKRFFSMLPLIVSTLTKGGVVVIDELETSMHPLLADTIVRLFNSPDLNDGRSQLMFSTHNTNLLSQDMLRRDQIWFVEKADGRSRYYSLDDFDKKTVTPHSPYIKWYLEGRFGALPSIDFGAIVSKIKALRANQEREDA